MDNLVQDLFELLPLVEHLVESSLMPTWKESNAHWMLVTGVVVALSGLALRLIAVSLSPSMSTISSLTPPPMLICRWYGRNRILHMQL
jgi:hypothetical protein